MRSHILFNLNFGEKMILFTDHKILKEQKIQRVSTFCYFEKSKITSRHKHHSQVTSKGEIIKSDPLREKWYFIFQEPLLQSGSFLSMLSIPMYEIQ